jgi:outer membrane lipoprotein SlyB
MVTFPCVEMTRPPLGGPRAEQEKRGAVFGNVKRGVKIMAEKELEITTNTYIFAGVGAVILGGLAAAALGGLQNTIAAGVVGALAGGCLGLFF